MANLSFSLSISFAPLGNAEVLESDLRSILKLNDLTKYLATLHPSQGKWSSAFIDFGHMKISGRENTGDADVLLMKEFSEAVGRFVDWLRLQPDRFASDLVKYNIGTTVNIVAFIDQNQIDINLPPEFLFECGRTAAGIYIISNE